MSKRLTAERWFGSLESRLTLLESTLAYIDQTSPSEPELINWIKDETNAADEDTISRQVSFLEDIGLLTKVSNQYELSDRGQAYLNSGDNHILLSSLHWNVSGFDRILSALEESPKPIDAIVEILQEQSEFTGGSQVAKKHLEWLQSLDYVEQTDTDQYRLTDRGSRAAAQLMDPISPAGYIQTQLQTYKDSADRDERLEAAETLATLVQDLVEELIAEYPNRIDDTALSTLRRLTQVGPSIDTKQERIADLELPAETIERFQDRVIDAGLVGAGQANVPMPEAHEDDAYDLLQTLSESDDPATLDAAVEAFAAEDIDGVQTGVLSPILYCLQPAYFPILNRSSITAVEDHFDIDVSNELTAYTANAAPFRRLRTELGLGGDGNDLRDLDWFLYTLAENAVSPHKQLFHVPLSDSGMKQGFHRTVLEPVATAQLEPHVETTFETETIPLWGTQTGIEAVEPGDWLLFGDRTAERYIAAAQVSALGAEELSDEAAKSIRDAVGWSDQYIYPGLIYLDTVHRFTIPATDVWDILAYDDFPNSGFQRVSPDVLDANVVQSPAFGSLDAFIQHLIEYEQSAAGYLIPLTDAGRSGGTESEYPHPDESEPATLSPETPVIGVDEDAVARAVGVSIATKEGSPTDTTTNGDGGIEWTYTLSESEGIALSEIDADLSAPGVEPVVPLSESQTTALREAIRAAFIDTHETAPYEATDNATLRRLLEAKQQLVFYGPPGTGKTYAATRFAEWLRAQRDRNVPGVSQIRTVTFHPSFAYEDFLEGFTASVEDEDVAYEYDPGSLKAIVEDARAAYEATVDNKPAPPFMLLIDEINRGNLAQIFGETITLLESDKRLGEPNEIITELAHSGEEFGIPPNLYLIGTMNTADESIALVDTALRRRFRFLSFPPQPEIPMVEHGFTTNGEPDRDTLPATITTGGDRLQQLVASSILAIETLNERILDSPQLGRGKQLGHTYLLGVNSPQELIDRWQYEILPQLEEYYFGQFGRLKTQLFDNTDVALFDWDTNQIASLTPESLYQSLCDIAGVVPEDRAPLATTSASVSPTETEDEDSSAWPAEKSVETFLNRLESKESATAAANAREIFAFVEERADIDPGGGDQQARMHIKHRAISDVGIYSLRDGGNLGFRFTEQLNKGYLTDADVIPALDRLEAIEAFEYDNDNRGEWTDTSGPAISDLRLEDLSEADLTALKDAFEILVSEATSE